MSVTVAEALKVCQKLVEMYPRDIDFWLNTDSYNPEEIVTFMIGTTQAGVSYMTYEVPSIEGDTKSNTFNFWTTASQTTNAVVDGLFNPDPWFMKED